MRALPPAQRAFVYFKVTMGRNNTDAARLAGYSEKGVDVTASRLAHDPRVQAALIEESKKVLKSQGAKSILTLVEIRDNPQAEDKDRIKCAVELMNRGGLSAVSESHLTVEHRLSESEQDRKILQLAAELGMSETEAKKLLIAPSEFQKNSEGVYSLPEVPAPDPSPQQQRNNERRRHRRKMTPAEIEADKAAIRAAQSERQRQEYQAHQSVTDAEFEEIADPLADLADVL